MKIALRSRTVRGAVVRGALSADGAGRGVLSLLYVCHGTLVDSALGYMWRDGLARSLDRPQTSGGSPRASYWFGFLAQYGAGRPSFHPAPVPSREPVTAPKARTRCGLRYEPRQDRRQCFGQCTWRCSTNPRSGAEGTGSPQACSAFSKSCSVSCVSGWPPLEGVLLKHS
jgi:hypothetical protein